MSSTSILSTICLLLCVWSQLLIAAPIPQRSIDAEEEVILELWHSKIGSASIGAVLVNKIAFIQPVDVFRFIKILATVSPDLRLLSGFYIDEPRIYQFDYTNRVITFEGHKYQLSDSDFIEIPSGKYVRSSVFETVFKLSCLFDYNGLTIEVRSEEKLPAELEAENSKKRNYLHDGTFDFHPEKTFPLQRSLFSLGTLDWSAAGNYSHSQQLTAYSFLTGGQLFGGDFDILFSGSNRQNIDWVNSPWQWRTVFNSDVITQLSIGRRASFSNLHLADSMVGFQITNAPLDYRTSFTSYQIADKTEPDWIVELYINDMLVNYTKADHTGFYKFMIQLPYGSTDVKLKFHGPYGEVRTSVMQLNIPYTFLPPGNFEYTLTAGTSFLMPTFNNSVGKIAMNAGISTWMTIGGGTRYFHDLSGNAQYEPFGTSSIRVTSNLLLSGEYRYRSGIKSSLNFLTAFGLSIDATYDHSFRPYSVLFDEFSVVEQRKLQITAPIPSLSSMIRFSGIDLPLNSDSAILSSTAELYTNISSISLNVSATAIFLRHNLDLSTREVIANSGISLSLFQGYIVRPSIYFDCLAMKPLRTELTLTHYFQNMSNVSITGRHGFINNDNAIQAEFRMALPFTQLGVISTAQTGQPPQINGTLQGSISFDPHATKFILDNQPSVRQGGIEIRPFLDLNGDGTQNKDEPLVLHFGVEQAPGKVIAQDDGILRVVGLEPYRKYVIKTSVTELENIAWMPKFKSFEIIPPANGFARIEIPITVAAQIEGYIYLNSEASNEPLGGVRLKIQHTDLSDSSNVVLSEDLLSYSNGEYYYLGLTPGKYRVTVDSAQLQLLHYSSTPEYIDILLQNKTEGDIAENLNFILKPILGPSTPPNTQTELH